MDEILTQEFVIAINNMYKSLTIYQVDQARGHQQSGSLLLQCATIGCSLLSNDMYVQALIEDARTGKEQLRFHRRDKRIITGRTHFDHFLKIEGRLLEEAGTDPGLAEAIIGRCREARKATRYSKFDANAFGGALEELRLAVCGVLGELRETSPNQPPPPQASGRLTSVLKGLGGCVVVGLDASSLAATVRLTAAGSAVSIAVGGAIVGQAITELSGTGCYPKILLLRRFRGQDTEIDA